MKARQIRFAVLTTLAACLAMHGSASAQTTDRPWYVGITQDFTHDSNILGTTTGEISDTVSTTSLRGGVNVPFGRQRFYGNASLSHQRYSELKERDNDGYAVGLGLDWSTIERLSGALTLNSQRRQADFNVGGIVPVTISNIERSDEVALRARLGADTMFAFEGGVGHRRVEFSAPEYASQEYKQDNANLGVVYRPSAIISLSAGVAAAETKYLAAAAGQTAPDRNKRRDLYVGANWVPTGASTINARLAYGKQEYDLATAANFKGVTGSLSWNWRPSGLLALVTTLSRDSGRESGFLRSQEGTIVSGTDLAQVTNRFGLTADYELTGKIMVTGALSYARRNLVDGFSGASGRDNTTVATIGARWAATRVLSIGCSVGRESRSASGTGSTDLDNDRYGCFGSLTFD